MEGAARLGSGWLNQPALKAAVLMYKAAVKRGGSWESRREGRGATPQYVKICDAADAKRRLRDAGGDGAPKSAMRLGNALLRATGPLLILCMFLSFLCLIANAGL